MADGSSTLRGRRAARAALLSLLLQVLCAGHLHMSSATELGPEEATRALEAAAAGDTAHVLVRDSPSNTRPAAAGAEELVGAGALRTAAPSLATRSPDAADAPDSEDVRRSGRAIAATVASEAGADVTRLSDTPVKIELESAAKESEEHLETNEVGVGNTAGRYFEDIRPTRTAGHGGAGASEPRVASTLESGEEEGASPSGRAGPRRSAQRATATPTDTARDEEEALVKKIWDVAEGAGREQPEEGRARGRALGHKEGEGAEAGTTPVGGPTNVTGRSEERKTNPDIQDIITGIVKLLNGNVKVQANTNLPGGVVPGGVGRPARPMTTRINNRGPPRITDLPPLPPLDFDAPSDMVPPPPPSSGPAAPAASPPSASTRLPPPYPFDRPLPAMTALPPQPNLPPNAHPFVNGVPLPEQVVPVSGGRPPPRPRPQQRPRPGPNRRPPHPSHQSPPSLPPQPPPARPPQDEMPVIPVTFHAFELLPSTGAEDEDGDDPTPETEDEDSSAQMEDVSAQGEDAPEMLAPPTPPPPPVAPHRQPPSPAPLPKPEKDSKKPMEPSKEKEPPAKMQPSSVSATPTKLPPPVPTVIGVEITASSTANMTSEYSDKKNSSTTTTTPSSTTVTTTTSRTPTSTTTEEPPQESEEASSTAASVSTTTSERPILLEPSLGVGVAVPVLESSMHDVAAVSSAPEVPGRPERPPSGLSSAAAPTAHLPPSAVQPSAPLPPPDYSYRPRPGLVLDDPEYKPAGGGIRPLGSGLGPPPSIVTAAADRPGEVFDVTVSAVQGPGGSGPPLHTGRPYVYPVEVESDEGGIPAGSGEVITSPQNGQHFVSIDGKRTYINLMGQPTAGPVQPSRPISPGSAPSVRPAAAPVPPARPPNPPRLPVTSHQPVHEPGVGSASAAPAGAGAASPAGPSNAGAGRPSFGNRRPPPAQPPVRIDTCIVGDASTCDEAQHERCRTEHGVSACHCRPGYSRRKHREPCRRIVSMLMSLRVDRLYERRVVWSRDLQDPSSDLYQQLQWEASRAVDSAMSMTPFSDDFLGARVNSVYAAPGTAAPVYVNLTLQLEETAETLRPAVRHDVQRHLLGVIHRRANNVGDSALWVDAPAGAVSHLQDVDECSRPDLHDCHPRAQCSNVFGGFRCACEAGLRDPWADQPQRAGRACEPCPAEHCGGRGTCHYDAQSQPVCTCSGNFYGAQCEVDGEVLGVAVGASVAAVVIIALTLVCLCMWSRRWNREQKAAVGSPVFGYLGAAGGTVKTPTVGAPPYQVSLEDRLRWAQIADVMAQANHYASPLACQQPEPSGTMPTRPSSAVFGYPALGGGALTGTLPPAPLPRLGLHGLLPAVPPPPPSTRAGSGARTLDNSSSGDDEDRTDLLGRGFHVPRPKSRSSVANQSGIYYDVDYDQSDIYGTKHASIPMNTYASRGSYHRQ